MSLQAAKDHLRAALAELDALDAPSASVEPPQAPTPPTGVLAWGAKVSSVFRDRVRWIGEDLGFDPNWLMACMAWESGRSFRSDIRNMAGSGATGLIQFMPATARGLGTTTDALAAMTPEDQLNFVFKYFAPFKGRIHSLSDLYMSILWPVAVGKPEDYPLFTSGVAYRQNAGLDVNKDGKVTKAEAASKVAAMLAEGLQPANVG